MKNQSAPDLAPADFKREGLNLCYCDPNLSNFLIPDPAQPLTSSPICVIDFEHASRLPISFLVWVFRYKSFTGRDERDLLAYSKFFPGNMEVLCELERILPYRYPKSFLMSAEFTDGEARLDEGCHEGEVDSSVGKHRGTTCLDLAGSEQGAEKAGAIQADPGPVTLPSDPLPPDDM